MACALRHTHGITGSFSTRENRRAKERSSQITAWQRATDRSSQVVNQKSTRSILRLRTMTLEGQRVGRIDDLLVDRRWYVRYLLVAKRRGDRLLIAPSTVREPHWWGSVVPISLTNTQLANSPRLVSDDQIAAGSTVTFGKLPCVGHLSSVNDMLSCDATARDGQAGRISDVFVDTRIWRLTQLEIITCRGWLRRKKARIEISQLRATQPPIVDLSKRPLATL
jgi:sporulation protein YlmC with PRC-barrel domain